MSDMSGIQGSPRAGLGAGAERDGTESAVFNPGTEQEYLCERGDDLQANLRALVREARQRGEADGLRIRRVCAAPVVQAYGAAYQAATGRVPDDLPDDLCAKIDALVAAGGGL